MRKIKFRQWTTGWMSGKNRMIDLGDIKDEDFHLLQQGEVMQYTGLKDKNGTEIYEGDIVEEWVYPETVRYDDDGAEIYTAHVHKGKVSNRSKVIFDEKRGVFDAPKIKGFWYYDLDKIEVIGNIYENSELLEGK
jgi:uncharacterized phage protein (TIGR01671 family)